MKALDEKRDIPGLRVFHFPADHSVGTLYRWHEAGRRYRPEQVVVCQGIVTVPSDERLELHWTYGISDLSPLDALERDDIASLEFHRWWTGLQSELAHVGRLTGLQELSLPSEGFCLSAEGARHLGELVNLKKFYGPRWVDDDALAYFTGFHALQELDLGHTEISGESLAAIGDLIGLQTLNVAACNIQDFSLRHLSRLKELRSLDVSQTEITSAGLSHLEGLTKLQELVLWDTGINDEGVAHLFRLSALKDLDLSHTAVTQAGVERLHHILPGCDISWP